MTELSRRDFLTMLDFPAEEIQGLVDRALMLKRGDKTASLAGRVAALMFFNPSVRTRVSCESAMARFGGSATTINPGRDTWNFECGDGVVMDGNTQEHVRELAPVLSRLVDCVGIRKSELITVGSAGVSATGDYAELAQDAFIHAFCEHSEVPVVNLESNTFHPMQGLADMATMAERIDEPRGRKYVLTWTWHPKSLPVATPHSQVVSAAGLGMDVTILRPQGWGLDPAIVARARERAEALGGSVTETDDMRGAFEGADVVCAKSWGSLDYYGRFDEEPAAKADLRREWIVGMDKMARTNNAFFLHCLPVRRNIVVTDEVLDSNRSAVIDEAENRLWTAAAVFHSLLGGR